MSREISEVALREALEPYVREGYAPGVVALVASRDEVVVVTIGDATFGGAAPMRRDSIFRMASMTKPVTAIAALMLVEDGKLALDEPVDRWLPELADRRVLRTPSSPLSDTVPARRAITVEDLLTFRLGFGLLFGGPEEFPILAAIAERGLVGFGPPQPAVDYGPDEYMRRLGELPLMAQPGEQWLYTAGSNVLGVLVARAAGMPLGEIMRERIFEPLGMADTGFFAPPDIIGRLTAAYVSTPDGYRLSDAPPDSPYARAPAFPAGDAGLVSTADDLLALSRLLLARGQAGGRRLLSEATVAAMTRDHLTAAQRAEGELVLTPGHGWGYGVSVALDRTPEGIPPGAFGWNGGFGTSWVMDPSSGATAILLTQRSFTSPEPPAVHKAFWRTVFASSGSA